MPPPFPPHAPEFVRDVLGAIIAGEGDELPVSALPVDGTFPTGTAQWEKRNIALEIPVWDPKICIQCGKCAMVCPHAVIRTKVYDASELAGAPATFKSLRRARQGMAGHEVHLQVAPEDCTGCGSASMSARRRTRAKSRLKAINMEPQPPLREPERENWEFFLKHSGTRPPQDQGRQRSASSKCSSRCSSSPAPAPAAARRPISSCSRSCSAIAL